MTLSAPPVGGMLRRAGKKEFGQGSAERFRRPGWSSLFHENVTIGQSVSCPAAAAIVYDLLNPTDVVVYGQVQTQVHPMPKLSQYASYTALAAALFIGFAVTVLAGMQF